MLAMWLSENHEEIADAAHAAHEASGHGAGHGEEHIPELPNLIGEVHHWMGGQFPQLTEKLDHWVEYGLKITDPMGTSFMAFENLIYAALIIIGLCAFFISGYLRLRKSPKEGRLSKRALFNEIVVLFFDDFFGQVMGKKESRKHLPFVGTLFIYILVCNCLGLVWLGKAPTANLSFNLGMALLVFLYVHFTGISRSPLGYLRHYPGDLPSVKELGMGCLGYPLVAFMAILFTIIHVLEALIQPLSLSLRLFGNVLGKDVLLGVFGGLVSFAIFQGMTKAGEMYSIGIAVPLHLPFLFLGLLLGAIQALIFSLLSAIYISQWLPHDDHGHEAEHA